MPLSITKVDLKERPSNREIGYFSVFIFLLVIVFLKSCWYPSNKALGEIKEKQEELIHAEKELGASDALASGVLWSGTLQEKKKYNQWAKALVSSPDSALAKELSNPKILRGLKIKNVDFQTNKLEDDVIEKEFSLSVFGSFVPVGQYLQAIEAIPNLLIMHSIEITTSHDKRGRVNANLKGRVYGWE